MIKYIKAETRESVNVKVNGEVKIVVGDLARIGAQKFKKVEFVKIPNPAYDKAEFDIEFGNGKSINIGPEPKIPV